MRNYKNFNQEQLNKELIDCCEKNKIEDVKYLLTSPELTIHADIQDGNDHALKIACYNYQLELVKYFLTSPELKEHSNVSTQGYQGFQIACRTGQLDMVKYFLTSPDIIKCGHSYPDSSSIDTAFTSVCGSGSMEIIQYLLTSTELEKNGIDFANIHAQEDLGIRWACRSGQLEVVKYLLTSTELTDHANIHAGDDSAFIWACEYEKLEVVEYLVFDYGIKLTGTIGTYLRQELNKGLDNELVLQLFNTREISQKLDKSLQIKSSVNKRLKI